MAFDRPASADPGVDDARVGADPDEPGSVLLLEDGPPDRVDAHCGALLSPGDPTTEAVVVVSLVEPPTERLAVRERRGVAPPARTVAVVAGSVSEAAEGVDAVFRVADPANLTRFGVALTEALASTEGHRPVLCFHSLSVLLQFAPVQRVYQFLSVLQTHLDAADATAHFHLDPRLHDDRTVATFRQLFDDVVSAGETD